MTKYHRPTIVRLQLPVALLLASVFLSCPSRAQGQRIGRLLPPAFISCDLNQLTSWTGQVTAYSRNDHSTHLEISTDEQTNEQLSIDHAGAADASAHYLLWGEAFTPADMSAIEAAPGTLIDGMRATAWICLDGKTAPVIDWRPPQD